MPWWDVYKLWKYGSTLDPLSQKNNPDNIPGVGVTSPEAIETIRGGNDGIGGTGRGYVRLHDSNDFIDLTSVSNRPSRYKEYERLRSIAEIETATSIFADEACVCGDTLVDTPFGKISMEDLAKDKANDRFLVYGFDEELGDITPAWAFEPRKVGKANVVQLILDTGKWIRLTSDHRVLTSELEWKKAGEITTEDKLIAFIKVPANPHLNNLKTGLFPRIFSYIHGWTHERAMIDRWRGLPIDQRREDGQKTLKLIGEGLGVIKSCEIMKRDWDTLESYMKKMGFTYKEIKWLATKPIYRSVIGVQHLGEMDVYDMSVEKCRNYCANGIVVHNCQKGDNGHVLSVECDNKQVKEELEWLYFSQLKIDRKLWDWAKNLFVYGDWFGELIINPDNPKDGILKVQPLPPDTMYRIETTRGRLVEFQQAKEGPDYQSLVNYDVNKSTEQELKQSTAIRFAPDQIVHIKINDNRKTFYPYGVSLIEPARGPAHQLRMMEDAMLVYRLCLIGDTRISTPDGFKLLKDIAKNDLVYSYDENSKYVATKVVNSASNGIKNVYRVKTQHTEITGTADHPILAIRENKKQYVEIQNLDIDKDKLIFTQDGKTIYESIFEITDAGQQEVFDIEVEHDAHNFIANGIPVHNSRAPERRVFYIDIGQISPNRAEGLVDRFKDQFRKKKTINRNGLSGATAVEERWHAPSQEEDYFVPLKSGSATRIETLPGAQNLGEIDDAIYFRRKLLIALNIPEGYMAGTDSTTIQTRITLSAQDVKFARQIERHQGHIEDGLQAIGERHLKLLGYPEEDYQDLAIKLTPSSDWRELSRQEVLTARLGNASAAKGAQIYSDYDILLDLLHLTKEDAERKLARMKVQKLEEVKLQIMSQNPGIIGNGNPGDDEKDISSEPGAGQNDIMPDEEQSPDQDPNQDPNKPQNPNPNSNPPPDQGNPQQPPNSMVQLPEPTEEDIKKYDLGIEDYNSEQDREDVDFSEI